MAMLFEVAYNALQLPARLTYHNYFHTALTDAEPPTIEVLHSI
jgi:hypothetical protein